VHDALLDAAQRVEGDAVGGAVALERLDLLSCQRVGDRLI
jgi:hypothetical protein